MTRLEYIQSLPSYFTGSFRQTWATLGRPIDFRTAGPCPVVLIPGAFCTSSVMNRLGTAIETRGRSVAVTPSFPYYLSAFANLCRLEQAATAAARWLDALGVRLGIEQVDVAAHSNGGLIALLAQAKIDAGQLRSQVSIRRLVTMATPFGGMPLARMLGLLLPCCRDLVDGAESLRLAEMGGERVARCLVSTADSLIPPSRQSLDADRRSLMEGYQHMDFIVGTEERVNRTAAEVVRWLNDAC